MREDAEKEMKRIEFAFSELKITDKQAEHPLELAKSYFVDAKHFFEKKDYEKSVRLLYYIFGILDSLATLKIIDPGKAKKHYKIDQ